MINTTDIFKNWAYNEQDREILVRIIFDGLDTSLPLDVSNWAINNGSVSRKMDYVTGKFSAGSHSFGLANNSRDGTYLFNLRNTVNGTDLPGTDYWQGEGYNVFLGLKESSGAVTIEYFPVLIPTMGLGATTTASKATPATMGYGVRPSNALPASSYSEETIQVYQGKVNKRTEDRIRETLNVSSNDVFKILNDTKICKRIKATDVFTFTSTEDDASIQQILALGKHVMRDVYVPVSRPTSSLSEETYSAIDAYPNKYAASRKGSIPFFRNPYRWWYVPVYNRCLGQSDGADYDDELIVWYWDYVQNYWRAISRTNFVNSDVYVEAIDPYEFDPDGVHGLYFEINRDNLSSFDDTWDDYVNATGSYWGAADAPDPKVSVETKSADENTALDEQNNFVLYLYKILTDTNFANLDTSIVDASGLWTDSDYTFDDAYSAFSSNNHGNVRYDSETSLMKIAQDITLCAGLMLICSQKKDSTSETLSGHDRRIKLIQNAAYTHSTDEPGAGLTFSTNREVSKYIIRSNNQRLISYVSTYNSAALAKKGEFDIISSTTSNDGSSLAIQTGSDTPKVYWYGNDTDSQAVVDNYISKLGVPWEEIQVTLDVRGVIVELGDYIKIYDHKMDENIVMQVYSWKLNLGTGNVDLQGKKVWSSLD